MSTTDVVRPGLARSTSTQPSRIVTKVFGALRVAKPNVPCFSHTHHTVMSDSSERASIYSCFRILGRSTAGAIGVSAVSCHDRVLTWFPKSIPTRTLNDVQKAEKSSRQTTLSCFFSPDHMEPDSSLESGFGSEFSTGPCCHSAIAWACVFSLWCFSLL